jgi:uncharacterized membrane protein (GlpM family)
MAWLVFKYLLTAAVVVLVSEAARRSDRLGAVIGALPLITILAMVWLYIEQQPASKIANHAYLTFWYVLPTLPMFFVFPWLLERLGFTAALLCGSVITVICFALLAAILKRYGLHLVG